MGIKNLFPTQIYYSSLGVNGEKLRRELLKEIEILQDMDDEGLEWSAKNYLQGYTSYSSLTQLHRTSPNFAELKKFLDGHVRKYSKALNAEKLNLELTDIWVNVMPYGAHHAGHIHPHSVISGTYYVSAPRGSSPLKLEDPRLPYLMTAPQRTTHYTVPAQQNYVVLFESWLRHEVAAQPIKKDRISISFNYA